MGLLDFLKNMGKKPAAETPKAEAAPEAKANVRLITYTVQKGDTLSNLAQVHLGDPSRYMEIFDANREKIADPNRIYPGQILKIPKAA